jgi:stage III sporulation protein AB
MWQKLIAAIFVMTGASGFGYSLCREMNSEITELKIQQQMLLYIMGEISYLRRPLEEIFDILSERLEQPYSRFLGSISDKMKERNGRSLKCIWNDEINVIYAEHGISKRAKTYLGRMADCFECEGDMIQVDRLELLNQELGQEIESLIEQKKEKSRLIRVLSTLGGIMCIVLFL